MRSSRDVDVFARVAQIENQKPFCTFWNCWYTSVASLRKRNLFERNLLKKSLLKIATFLKEPSWKNYLQKKSSRKKSLEKKSWGKKLSKRNLLERNLLEIIWRRIRKSLSKILFCEHLNALSFLIIIDLNSNNDNICEPNNFFYIWNDFNWKVVFNVLLMFKKTSCSNKLAKLM